MSSSKNDCDAASVVLGIAVFALPLTLLIPDFSIWDVIPKVKIIRLHVFEHCVTWTQLNAALVTLLVLFYCLYLDIRKRELDEMVESVLKVSQATDVVMEVERERQAAEMRACVQLLDASAEHYERLIMLRDDLRKRDRPNNQHPPTIEPSTSQI